MSSQNTEIEESLNFVPKFDVYGLIPTIVIDFETREILMLAYVNSEALDLTLTTGFGHYFSRARKKIWKKGEDSGFTQSIKKIRLDCDQDTLIFEVEQQGQAACHTGRHSCFYREISLTKSGSGNSLPQLEFVQAEKVFDPNSVYKK